MKTRKALFHILPLLLAATLLDHPAAGKDLLDIKALSLNPVGQVYPSWSWGQTQPAPHALRCLADHKTVLLREGETIGLYCRWSINIVNSDTCWIMQTPWHNTWPGFFTYGGAKIFPFTGTVPYDLALGTCTQQTGLSTLCFPDFWNSCGGSSTTHYPNSMQGAQYIQNGWGLGFTGNKLGLHTVTCEVDTPKSFSDRYSSNNKAYLRIKVVPKGVRVNPSSYHQCTNEVALFSAISSQ